MHHDLPSVFEHDLRQHRAPSSWRLESDTGVLKCPLDVPDRARVYLSAEFETVTRITIHARLDGQVTQCPPQEETGGLAVFGRHVAHHDESRA
ncbi:MAG: hypothetical protein KC468_15835 [Myxococcales bacterium]|nr:hypothetical protein [Myxococcales bacterium]